MHLKKILLAASFACTMALGATLATAAHADSFTVFTGYADTLRSSGFFPTTWIGDPNVVSQSTNAQQFDSGAVRIDNNGASAITIDNFTVTMNGGSGPTYNIWSSLTIGAGQHGIFTQTGEFNFDSSDNSFGSPVGNIFPTDPGANGIGGCSSTLAAQVAAGIDALCAGRQPIVSFMIGAQSFSFNDTGHILDTGNYDFVNFSPDLNESINWNIIGRAANRGGNGIPEPGTWALMLLGFGGLGAALRRHRRVAFA